MKGLASPKLLDTYETERKHIATQLINFDAEFAKAFTQRTNLYDTTLYVLWQERGWKIYEAAENFAQ
jgi:phenol 2-monooxygenase